MSFTLAATLASSMTLPSCSWDQPGADPYMGDVVAAVDRYTDIPEPVRARLKARMETRQYDEIAAIRRDSVTGKRRYAPEIRDMHFGQGQVCRAVTRAKWADHMVERGLVYCESSHCILVPTVCRNVSRIKRLGGERVAAAGDEQFLKSEELLARAGAGGGGGGGSGGGSGGAGPPGRGGSPMAALGATPGGEAAAGGAAGESSFRSVSGLDNAGTGGNYADTFGPASPLPGVGGGDFGAGSPYGPSSNIPVPEVSPVPEPGNWLMALLGLAGVIGATRLSGGVAAARRR